MIAVETNLLVDTHRSDLPFHRLAREARSEGVVGAEPVSVPWPCLREFRAVISELRLVRDPTLIDVAISSTEEERESRGTADAVPEATVEVWRALGERAREDRPSRPGGVAAS